MQWVSCVLQPESASTAVVKEQCLPPFWLKREKPTGHFMADLTEWPCLLKVPTNLLRKGETNGSLLFLVRLRHEIRLSSSLLYISL